MPEKNSRNIIPSKLETLHRYLQASLHSSARAASRLYAAMSSSSSSSACAPGRAYATTFCKGSFYIAVLTHDKKRVDLRRCQTAEGVQSIAINPRFYEHDLEIDDDDIHNNMNNENIHILFCKQTHNLLLYNKRNDKLLVYDYAVASATPYWIEAHVTFFSLGSVPSSGHSRSTSPSHISTGASSDDPLAEGAVQSIDCSLPYILLSYTTGAMRLVDVESLVSTPFDVAALLLSRRHEGEDTTDAGCSVVCARLSCCAQYLAVVLGGSKSLPATLLIVDVLATATAADSYSDTASSSNGSALNASMDICDGPGESGYDYVLHVVEHRCHPLPLDRKHVAIESLDYPVPEAGSAFDMEWRGTEPSVADVQPMLYTHTAASGCSAQVWSVRRSATLSASAAAATLSVTPTGGFSHVISVDQLASDDDSSASAAVFVSRVADVAMSAGAGAVRWLRKSLSTPADCSKMIAALRKDDDPKTTGGGVAAIYSGAWLAATHSVPGSSRHYVHFSGLLSATSGGCTIEAGELFAAPGDALCDIGFAVSEASDALPVAMDIVACYHSASGGCASILHISAAVEQSGKSGFSMCGQTCVEVASLPAAWRSRNAGSSDMVLSSTQPARTVATSGSDECEDIYKVLDRSPGAVAIDFQGLGEGRVDSLAAEAAASNFLLLRARRSSGSSKLAVAASGCRLGEGWIALLLQQTTSGALEFDLSVLLRDPQSAGVSVSSPTIADAAAGRQLGGTYTVAVTPDPEFGLGIVLGEVASGNVGVLGFKRHPMDGSVLRVEACGDVEPGDELLAVNGASLVGLRLQDTIAAVRRVTLGGGGAAVSLSLKRSAAAETGRHCSVLLRACAARCTYSWRSARPLPVDRVLAAALLVLPGAPDHAAGSTHTGTIVVAVAEGGLALHSVLIDGEDYKLSFRRLKIVEYEGYSQPRSLEVWPVGYMNYAVSTTHVAPEGELFVVLSVLTIRLDGGGVRPGCEDSTDVAASLPVALRLLGLGSGRWRLAGLGLGLGLALGHCPRCLLASDDGLRVAICEPAAATAASGGAQARKVCALQSSFVIHLQDPLLEVVFVDKDLIRATTIAGSTEYTRRGSSWVAARVGAGQAPNSPFFASCGDLRRLQSESGSKAMLDLCLAEFDAGLLSRLQVAAGGQWQCLGLAFDAMDPTGAATDPGLQPLCSKAAALLSLLGTDRFDDRGSRVGASTGPNPSLGFTALRGLVKDEDAQARMAIAAGAPAAGLTLHLLRSLLLLGEFAACSSDAVAEAVAAFSEQQGLDRWALNSLLLMLMLAQRRAHSNTAAPPPAMCGVIIANCLVSRSQESLFDLLLRSRWQSVLPSADTGHCAPRSDAAGAFSGVLWLGADAADYDVLSHLRSLQVALWMLDLSAVLPLVEAAAKHRFRSSRDSMDVFLEMVLAGKAPALAQYARVDGSRSGKQLLALLAQVDFDPLSNEGGHSQVILTLPPYPTLPYPTLP